MPQIDPNNHRSPAHREIVELAVLILHSCYYQSSGFTHNICFLRIRMSLKCNSKNFTTRQLEVSAIRWHSYFFKYLSGGGIRSELGSP